MTVMIRGSVTLCAAGLALTGCAAAIVPVAASGLLAHRGLRHKPSAPAATPVRAAPQPGIAREGGAVAEAMPLPSNLALAKPDRVYAGTLPPPSGAPVPPAAVPVSAPAPSPVLPAPEPRKAAPRAGTGSGRGWSGLVRHVAEAVTDGAAASVLLDRSSTAANPVWLPCGTRPRAVLIDLDAIRATGGRLDTAAKDDLDALRTMDMTAVFFSVQPPAEVARGQALMAQAGLVAPVAGRDLFTGAPGHQPALRAAIGARFCIVALLGVRAEDFPNAILPGAPGASEGWFLEPASPPAPAAARAKAS